MSTDALVVGGSIHVRLAERQRLRAEGFHVTLEGSARRGLTRLEKHAFALCALDLTDVPQARDWRRRYGWATRTQGTELRELTTTS